MQLDCSGDFDGGEKIIVAIWGLAVEDRQAKTVFSERQLEGILVVPPSYRPTASVDLNGNETHRNEP
jgi:hypothetical protein